MYRWFRPDGEEMNDDEWSHAFVRCFGMLLDGQVMDEWDERGQHLRDDIFLLLLNAHHESIAFLLPAAIDEHPWEVLVDTTTADVPAADLFAPVMFSNSQHVHWSYSDARWRKPRHSQRTH